MAIIVVVLIVVAISWGYPKYLGYQQEKVEKTFERQYKSFILDRSPDNWWLLQAPKIGVVPTKEEIQKIDARVAKIEEKFQRYAEVSPLSKRIASQFKELFVSILTEEGVSVSNSLQKEEVLKQPDIEICFIAANIFRQHPNAVYYSRQRRSLMIAGVEWPETVFAGMLFHEAGHALFDIVDHAPSASANPRSNSYISEEIVMHELEIQVVDAATGGAFLQEIDKIIQRTPAKTPQDLVYRASLSNWQRLDEIMGATTAGPIVSDINSAQYDIALAFRFIEKRGGGRSGKVAFYRWFRFERRV